MIRSGSGSRHYPGYPYEINRFDPHGNRVFAREIWDNIEHSGANRYVYRMRDKGTMTVYAKDKKDVYKKILKVLK
jgi:hypothetical protein